MTPKRIRLDRGGEYTSIQFIHENAAPYPPQQNGVVQRKNRSLIEMVKIMLSESKLPDKYRVYRNTKLYAEQITS